MRFLSRTFWWYGPILLVLGVLAVATTAYHSGVVKGRSDIPSFERRISELDHDLGIATTRLAVTVKDLARSADLNDDLRERLESTNAKLVASGEALAVLRAKGGGRLSPRKSRPPVPTKPVQEPVIEEVVVGPCPECLEGECGEWGYRDFRIDAYMDTCGERFQYHLTQKFKIKLKEVLERTGETSTFLEMEELNPLTGDVLEQVPLESFDVVRIKATPPRSFQWWAPHLDIGLSLLSSYRLEPMTAASVGFTFGGYGRTVDDHLWRYGRISLQIGREVGIGVSPFGVNLGQGLPLISDLWIWPIWTYDGTNGFGLVVGTTF